MKGAAVGSVPLEMAQSTNGATGEISALLDPSWCCRWRLHDVNVKSLWLLFALLIDGCCELIKMVYCFIFITSFLRSEKKVENEWEWDWTLGSPLSCWLFIQCSTAVSTAIWKNCNLVHFCMIIVLYQRNSWVFSKAKKQIALLSVTDALRVQMYFSSLSAPFYWFASIPMFVFATVKHIFFFFPLNDYKILEEKCRQHVSPEDQKPLK